MNPTDEQLKNRELALQNIQAGEPQDTGVISASDLQTPQGALQVPTAPQPTNYQATADAGLQSILDSYKQQTATQTQGTDLQNRLLKTIETLGGEKQRQVELQQEAGLPEQQKQKSAQLHLSD